ncbi:TraB/GumN family protein [archaeon]|nr:MAG: TraB/GumN family protein [archaeon]
MGVKRVEVDGNEVVLVGTAHVSKRSRELVRETLEEESPDIVGVELDKGRRETLINEPQWQETNVYDIIRSGRAPMFLASLLLTNFQKRMGEELGTKPGAEMLEAIEYAGDAPVELLDRDINTTFKRAWQRMSLREKLKILYSVLFSFLEEGEAIDEGALEKLQEEDALNAMLEELAQEIPSVKEVLIDERDAYIAAKIQGALSGKTGATMVAVVGAGHINGIVSHLPAPVDAAPLERVERSRSWFKIVAWGVPVLLAALLVIGFYTNGADVTVKMLKAWFLINGTLSTVGVICALGHPLSALVAFLAAPFTSLNPTLAAGWFAGLTEAHVRKPKVRDFESLGTIAGVTDLWRNKITRTLLVVAFANIGSTIGTAVALPWIISLL